MEVFAAALSHADAQFGRILDALEASGELDNTMVIITSDNGASAEGAPHGTFSEHVLAAGAATPLADNLPFFEEWGGPKTFPHYSFGWAVAGNSPFRYYKQTAHEGGTRVPLIVAWPKGIAARGELRGQFVHVSDIAPTILAATGVAAAQVVNDVEQSPMEGQNITATFADPRASGHQGPQYVEMYGNKGLWDDGWSIVTTHRYRTWDISTETPIDEPWELYDLARDPGQIDNLAARHPEKVATMARAFDEQAKRYNVYPIGNIAESRPDGERRARLDFERRGGKWRYAGPVGNITGQMAPPVAFRSYRLTASLDLPQGAVTGPVFAYGGQLGGTGLYLRQGRPVFLMTTLKGETVEVAASEALPAGATSLELAVERAPAAPTSPTDFAVTIRTGGKVLAQQTVRFAMPMSFGIAETFGVGIDDGSPVLAGTRGSVPFPGRLGDVVFDFSESGTASR
jgi:arylsulfatase